MFHRVSRIEVDYVYDDEVVDISFIFFPEYGMMTLLTVLSSQNFLDMDMCGMVKSSSSSRIEFESKCVLWELKVFFILLFWGICITTNTACCILTLIRHQSLQV